MPINLPTLDDRTYSEILAEAKARIAVHNPEWTNANDSDPGVTLLQLFAFLTESTIYRANLIPERNRLKFLRLLGIGLEPAAAAKGLVTFSNPKGALQPMALRRNAEVLAGSIPFRTIDDLVVLPVDLHVCYKARVDVSEEEKAEVEALYEQLYSSYDPATVDLQLYQTTPLQPPSGVGDAPRVHLTDDTVDGALWIAVLARTGDASIRQSTIDAIATQVLSLGIVPSIDEDNATLAPGDVAEAASEGVLMFERPVVEETTGDDAPPAHYAPLEVAYSGDPLAGPAIAKLTLPGPDDITTWSDLDPLDAGAGAFPPTIDDDDIAARVLTWIRVRSGRAESRDGGSIQVALSHVGAHAARVEQRARVAGEVLGRGTGQTDQTFSLVNTPVLLDNATITVNGEAWTRIDDLAAAGPEVVRSTNRSFSTQSSPSDSKVYTLDRESGELTFGDGLRGARPADGASIIASYDYGGGRDGLVGIGEITKGPTLPAGVKVTNPIQTWGGADAESVDDGIDNISAHLRHRDRLVTAQDFEDIVTRTPGADVGRVDVLPLVNPALPDVASPGTVTLMVIPAYDAANPDHPTPDQFFLDTICDYVNPRRLVTTEIHLVGPYYIPIALSVGIEVVAGRDSSIVREDVKSALRAFLSSLSGGHAGQGWPLLHDVDNRELWTIAARVDGVSSVTGVILADLSGVEQAALALGPLELPLLAALAVQSGDPSPIADVLGDIEDADAGHLSLPVPIVPAEC